MTTIALMFGVWAITGAVCLYALVTTLDALLLIDRRREKERAVEVKQKEGTE